METLSHLQLSVDDSICICGGAQTDRLFLLLHLKSACRCRSAGCSCHRVFQQSFISPFQLVSPPALRFFPLSVRQSYLSWWWRWSKHMPACTYFGLNACICQCLSFFNLSVLAWYVKFVSSSRLCFCRTLAMFCLFSLMSAMAFFSFVLFLCCQKGGLVSYANTKALIINTSSADGKTLHQHGI